MVGKHIGVSISALLAMATCAACAAEIEFASPLPRMRVDGRSVGTSNSESFAVPGVATTSDASLGKFVKTLRDAVRADRRKVFVQGRVLTCSINWIRDHIHQSAAFRHWEYDLTTFLDYILDTQRQDGQFYEMLLPIDREGHWRNSNPSCYRLFPDDFLSLVRFETESDIEYLMVEGCERAWRAKGDDAWLKAALPRLEKGIAYLMSNPSRWDAERGLVKRPYTIDTWDFTFRPDPDSGADLRKIIPGYTPMAIMHGDNTGLYAALKSLAGFERRLGRDGQAKSYEEAASRLRDSVMKHLWNGTHFIHQLPVDPPQGRDGNERNRLSMSNAHALNRGILSMDERRAIVGEFMRRRKTGTAFAEWFTVDPPYEPCFGANGKFPAGQYMNGAISPVTAGELARGAFQCGYEAYGWDILVRLMDLVERDGRLYFLYHPKTREGQGRGPVGWAAAAVLNAIDEGLAGIVDLDTGYREIAFSPRWPATPYAEVRYVTGYEVSDAYVDCRYVLTDRGMRYRLKSPAALVRAHLLVPEGRTAADVRIGARSVPFERARVGDSAYIDLVAAPAGGELDVEVIF